MVGMKKKKKLHLNLHASQKHPFQHCDESFDTSALKIKVEGRTTEVEVNLKVISDSCYSVGVQEKHGCCFDVTKYYTFEMTGETIDFVIRLYKEKECIGLALLPEPLLTEDYGSIKVCLVNPKDALKPVAYITFDYLFLPCPDIEKGKVQNQNLPSGFVYMGHRGCGKTIDRTAKVLENTLESFKEAKDLGASFVELDIQLTKDLVPIIFHDDFVAIFAQDRNGKHKVTHVPVKDLTLEEVKSLKVDFARDGSGLGNDERFFQLFPTLKELLTSKELPNTLTGFFLEVKYTEPDQGIVGLMNKKVVVEKILKVLHSTRYSRKIMFCSFDPDICLLLKHMQSELPVFFLTCGENSFTSTNPSEPYDIRTRTRKIAANFAKVHDLDGISINCDPLMNCKDEYMELTRYLKSDNKALYSWGSANNSPEFVAVQKSIGISGVISDSAISKLTHHGK